VIYAKVFASLWDGSLRGDSDAQIVFIYMLAHSDEDGVVDIIRDKIADDLGWADDGGNRLAEAILRLESQDAHSRNPNEDGRRIEPSSPTRTWGWRIINYDHYRKIRNRIDRKEQNREAQRRWRERKQESAPVSVRKRASAESAQEEVEVEVEVEGKAKQKDFDSVLGSISDSLGLVTADKLVSPASKLAFRKPGKDPGPKWWNSIRVQASLHTLTEGGSSMDEARMLVLAQARAEGWV
jgi:hypothetical protein